VLRTVRETLDVPRARGEGKTMNGRGEVRFCGEIVTTEVAVDTVTAGPGERLRTREQAQGTRRWTKRATQSRSGNVE
jgi:hypothetical protein